MDYISMYRRKSQSSGKNMKEKIINEGRKNFKKHLDSSPSAHDVQVTKPNETCVSNNTRFERCLINNITLNDQRSLDEKYIHFLNEVDIRIGCYVKWDGQDWLLVFREHNGLDTHKTYVMRKCSQIFRYKYKGIVYDIPMCVSNLTLYSDGMADSKHTSIPDSKREIKFGLNEITKNIQLGTRFLLTRMTAFRITHMNNFEHNDGYTGADGVVTAIGLQTALNAGDDIENNIAENEKEVEIVTPDGSEIMGSNYIVLGDKSKYTCNRSGSLEWRLKEQYEFVKIFNQTTQDCIIKVSNNAKYVDYKFILEVLSEGRVVDSKEIKLRGFL